MNNVKTNVHNWGAWATRRYYQKRGMIAKSLLTFVYK